MPEKLTGEESNWAMMLHLMIFVNFIAPLGFILALICWLVKKDESRFIRNHGAEAINFQISIFLYTPLFVILFFYAIVASETSEATALLSIILYLIGTFGSIFLFFYAPIRGAIKAKHGEEYLYPFCIRFIKPLPPV